MSFTRNLTIECQDLGKEATIMFTFDDSTNESMYKDKFPVCWKVIIFPADGPILARVTFQSQYAFAKPQVGNNRIVDVSTYMRLEVGQSTTLTKSDDGVYTFSVPTTGDYPDSLQAKNASPSSESLALTCITSDSRPTPVLYFDSVASGTFTSAQFVPRLRAYIISDYEFEETGILRGQIASPVIWEQNLADLDESSTWALTYDPLPGVYALRQVS
ncbi:hypothetical protein BU15DRAFT_82151 [Melanogaster broomeanus]|nr:hypothetical protein BU15DRAFT_82151 [Melanogaster broomeanus]